MGSAALILLWAGQIAVGQTAAESVPLEVRATVDFSRDIRPLLSNYCYTCHGPDAAAREADLRLDLPAETMRERDEGVVIAPFDPDHSLVIQRVESQDETMQMPPPESGLSLTPRQKELLRKWVKEGARFETHWSFQSVRRPPLPKVQQHPWVRNEIDQFVLHRMEAEGLSPSIEADRATLIRRLSLDLLGLPPSVAEVEAFIEDAAPDAYTRLVDRLLVSPRYGERWGRHWLDQARYADTNGYTVDSERSMWPFRDWVIAALNRDMPFDQFTIEQLAGDLLPSPTQAQLVATGFHRNTLINQEGGTDKEQFRNETVVDRVNTTSAVWLGMTYACGQCHSHKFDPLSQEEYYRLFAFFNNDQDENGVAPTLRVFAKDQQERLATLDAELAEHRTGLEEYRKNNPQPDSAKVVWDLATGIEAVSEAGAEFELLEDGSQLVKGENAAVDTYTLRLESPEETVTALRLEVLPHPSLPKNGPGRAGNGNFVLDRITLLADGNEQAWLHASADHSQKQYDVKSAIDGKLGVGWAINVERGNMNVARTAQFVLKHSVVAAKQITIKMEFGNKPPQYNIGRFRISTTAASATDLGVPDPELVRLEQTVKKKEEQRAQFLRTVPTTMVLRQRTPPRGTHLLVRGDFLRKGKPVTPGVPAVLPELEHAGETPTRLHLAQWLCRDDNPLTARVTVNRIWMRFFGKGLVETENDFGIQGSLPTHPHLLDWLAVEFMQGGWSMKRLQRQIAMSATYRQSSKSRPDLVADSGNALLARQRRIRVEAEIVRDISLQVAGLLSTRLGGPSVHPPQPGGVYAFTQRKASWPTSKGEARFRRGMYTFFMRSAPYPMLTTFDVPRFNATCTRRIRSNTPLQSLAMANDVVMIEISRAFARQALEWEVSTDRDRVELAFRTCLAREPSAEELETLANFLVSMRQQFSEDPDSADLVAGPGGSGVIELAAWTSLARAVFNLDEFITRE